MGVDPKIGGKKPKMDGENNGKPYEQIDDLVGFTPIFGNIQIKNPPIFCCSPFSFCGLFP